MATLTPEAKQLLSRTVRELRARLLADLHDATEGRYRLSLPIDKAKLTEDLHRKRERLEAWLDERVRTVAPKDKKVAEAARARFLVEAQKEAAATLLNRLVLLRHLEALGLSKPAVLTGGWTSKGYTELREFAPGLCGDETEGYAALLHLVFDELALDLPGLFGDVGLTRLFPVPPASLREVVQRFDDPELLSAWTDDTTLGWVYQYWNDPEREALDAKLNDGGKIEPHEIASKTQMFTERYMVEWLLQNSLGLTWLCMCKKHGWTADAEQVLPVLDARRAEWRKKREAGEVALDALMPIEGELEEHWKYYVPQPIPNDAVATAPESVKTLKLLDPACGSGHFLVIAFDLLAALYREEARHRGETVSEKEIAESILGNNLHGIDIDPRAVQIAAAAVVLKAKRLARNARPARVNLVAPLLRLGSLKADDPALVRLKRELRSEAGIPEVLTEKLVEALAGVDHLGSLLKVDAAIEDAIREVEKAGGGLEAGQGDLLTGRFPERQAKIDWSTARVTLLERLEAFLARHSGEEDLGLRLDGEQLAAGVRFIRIAKERTYHLLLANPPYQSADRLADSNYLESHYSGGHADIYAAFLLRSLEFIRPGGLVAMVAMRGWMFLAQYKALRARVLAASDVRSMADLGTGAFSSRSMDDVISSAMFVLRGTSAGPSSVAIRAAPLADATRDAGKPVRRRASLMCQEARFEFDTSALAVVEGRPLIYWWGGAFLRWYGSTQKLGEVSPARLGINTGDNARFLRFWWEVARGAADVVRHGDARPASGRRWLAYIGGAKGRIWFEELRLIVNWASAALEMRVFDTVSGGVALRNLDYQLKRGVAFAMIGAACTARLHRYVSVFDSKGSSVFHPDPEWIVCLLNRTASQQILQALNPSISFQVGDVNRLPLAPVADSGAICQVLEGEFSRREAAREQSVEFRGPGAHSWNAAQAWAGVAVDREVGRDLVRFEPHDEEPRGVEFVSFAVGVALGRFGVGREGVQLVASDASLPSGCLFLSAASGEDSLAHSACASLHSAWAEHGPSLGEADDLRTYLRSGYFKHHKSIFENRPIYFPLSSAKRNFVAWVSIHRWTSNTLTTLLADHLVPERRRLEGELDDLRKARAKGEKGGKGAAEKRFADVQKLLEELVEFIDNVTQCAERGPPPTSPNETRREVDVRYEMDLDDGVMVSSAALWPLLEPQWKDPKKWWKELAEAKGRKDYDWAHLAKRYFPSRVEEKCKADPSLGVAHGCFWRLHPAKAYAWELRLQDEIRPDFTIDEPGSGEYRAKFIADHADEARAIRQKEAERRERKARKAGEDESMALDFGEAEGPSEEEP
ncbi:MAG: BREX-6 system adenine-specific DNA-methyltransferase PglX [Deltaproteobacteria bacterium]|nr:BREX-6 system adenine-specific DNA-methyltransferase PglX [Deltaproteobacteria bacterium]